MLSIPILTFHAFDHRPLPTSFPPDLFRTAMIWLRESGFRTLTVTEAWRCLRTGTAPCPRPIAISLDDGYQSVFEVALPVLRDLGFTATVFLNGTPDTPQLPPMDGRPRMTWTQLEALRDARFEIGAHTLTHPNLTRLPEPRIQAEIAGSQTAIQSRLGVPVTAFAYPYGRWNEAARRVASRHYECACTTSLRLASGSSEAHTLPRIDTHYLRSMRTFQLLASPALPAYLTARRIPRSLREVVQSAWTR